MCFESSYSHFAREEQQNLPRKRKKLSREFFINFNIPLEKSWNKKNCCYVGESTTRAWNSAYRNCECNDISERVVKIIEFPWNPSIRLNSKWAWLAIGDCLSAFLKKSLKAVHSVSRFFNKNFRIFETEIQDFFFLFCFELRVQMLQL